MRRIVVCGSLVSCLVAAACPTTLSNDWSDKLCDSEGKCLAGWECDPATNRCVPAGTINPADAAADAAVTDARIDGGDAARPDARSDIHSDLPGRELAPQDAPAGDRHGTDAARNDLAQAEVTRTDTFSATDRDGDGINNADDNCPECWNPDQANSGGVNCGDVCEPSVGSSCTTVCRH